MDQQKQSKAIHIILWIAQIILAAIFLMTGFMKSFQPIEELATTIPWVSSVPSGLVRFIGISELLGGMGLVLPALLRIKPKLTIWAAIGLATIMILAVLFHLSRGELAVIGMNMVLLLLAGFIAWGRLKKAPIHTLKSKNRTN